MGYGINSNLTKLITEINRGAKPDAVIYQTASGEKFINQGLFADTEHFNVKDKGGVWGYSLTCTGCSVSEFGRYD